MYLLTLIGSSISADQSHTFSLFSCHVFFSSIFVTFSNVERRTDEIQKCMDSKKCFGGVLRSHRKHVSRLCFCKVSAAGEKVLRSVDTEQHPKSLFMFVLLFFCAFDRDLGGETMLRETIRGALSAQRERYCLSHRGLCHHAAGMRHAGGGQTPQQTRRICLRCFFTRHTVNK